MSSSEDYREWKREQREALKTQRQNEVASVLAEPKPKKPKKVAEPGQCKECFGTRVRKTLFSKIECEACFGTGLDLSNAEAVVRQLFSSVEMLKKKTMRLESELRDALTTKEEREEKAVSQFYEGRRLKGD